jgi:hypothetical protein
MQKKEIETLKTALKLPGMQSHLRRKKAAWKNPCPSRAIIYTWVQHRIADELHSQLMKTPLSILLNMQKLLNYRRVDYDKS